MGDTAPTSTITSAASVQDKSLNKMGSAGGSSVQTASGRTPDGRYHDFKIGAPPNAALYGRIPNKNKVVNICLYKYESNEFLKGDLPRVIDDLRIHTDQWDNWKRGVNALENGEPCVLPEVPASVMPVTDDLKIECGYKYDTISATEAMKEGGGAILGTVKDTAKKIGGVAMSINAAGTAIVDAAYGDRGIGLATASMNATESKSTVVTSKIDSFNIYNADNTQYNDPKQLKLSFNFGGGGYFDGEIEVVRPIIALASAIAPQFVGGEADGPKNRVRLPGANPAQFYAATWGGTVGAGFDALAEILSDGKDFIGSITSGVADIAKSSSARQALSNTGSALQNSTNELVKMADGVVKATINGMEYAISAAASITTVLFYRIGQYIAGPFQIDSVNYSFDYSMVDEAGYPYRGDINIGLKNIYKPEARDIVAQAGYKIG